MKKVLFALALTMMAGTIGSAYAAKSSETVVVVNKDKGKKGKKKHKKSCCSEAKPAGQNGSCATGANAANGQNGSCATGANGSNGTQSSCCSHKK